ncbi:Hypoxia induced protein, domain protein [Niveomyces insectorum RCEF 264]|uniref:Hypoxia induced protein, domain protein n=1 Tax=Niveomyces insectorum RCEF 264 TaxID=1081102 RepID=A0A167TGZ0_9HYPO|nr:Hypoxia induced protein, domain protein [Niveomyces insectorum RCEF 264]
MPGGKPDEPVSGEPLPSSFDEDALYNEPPLQKLTRKLKAEPLIPLGCALTVAAFISAWRASRRGDHKQVQRMFRARVLAQGFTVLAMVGGGIYYGAERQKERALWKVQQAQKDEDKRVRWIRELEARDAEEKALQAKAAERRERRERRAASGGGGDSPAADKPSQDGAAASGSSILSSLGGWFGGGGNNNNKNNTQPNDAAAVDNPVPAPQDPADATAATVAAGAKKAPRKATSTLDTLGGLFGRKGDKAADDEANDDAKK